MARGKYSPTVNHAYWKDQEWWHKYSREAEEFTLYDPEGYDSYGYNEAGLDRAGNSEFAYYGNDNDSGENYLYDSVADAWGFDGEKPVKGVW
jgi:hypothetical protein